MSYQLLATINDACSANVARSANNSRRLNVVRRTNKFVQQIYLRNEFVFGLTCHGAYGRSFKSEFCKQTRLPTIKESVLFS